MRFSSESPPHGCSTPGGGLVGPPLGTGPGPGCHAAVRRREPCQRLCGRATLPAPGLVGDGPSPPLSLPPVGPPVEAMRARARSNTCRLSCSAGSIVTHMTGSTASPTSTTCPRCSRSTAWPRKPPVGFPSRSHSGTATARTLGRGPRPMPRRSGWPRCEARAASLRTRTPCRPPCCTSCTRVGAGSSPT